MLKPKHKFTDLHYVLKCTDLLLNGKVCYTNHHHHHYHNRFTALFPGPSGWASARRELLDFMVQGKINRGRHSSDHPAGRHSI